jgi:ferredoxin
MIRLVFEHRGASVPAEAEAGARLLDVAQAAGMPLEGTCGGQLACATCHVVIAADWASRLPPPGEAEEDMLDLVPAATRTSRLACQVRLTEALDGMVVRVT